MVCLYDRANGLCEDVFLRSSGIPDSNDAGFQKNPKDSDGRGIKKCGVVNNHRILKNNFRDFTFLFECDKVCSIGSDNHGLFD